MGREVTEVYGENYLITQFLTVESGKLSSIMTSCWDSSDLLKGKGKHISLLLSLTLNVEAIKRKTDKKCKLWLTQ